MTNPLERRVFLGRMNPVTRRYFLGGVPVLAAGAGVLVLTQRTGTSAQAPDSVGAVLLQELPRIASELDDNIDSRGELDLALRFFAAYLKERHPQMPQELAAHVTQRGCAGLVQHAKQHLAAWTLQNLSAKFRDMLGRVIAETGDDVWYDQLDRALAGNSADGYVGFANEIRADRPRYRRAIEPVVLMRDHCGQIEASAEAAAVSAALICTCCGPIACAAAVFFAATLAAEAASCRAEHIITQPPPGA